jgi:hypothetical protein
MIIYGTSGREIPVGEGQFHCPRCLEPQHFRHTRISRYFTLYFIPLFPISNQGEYVECSGCGGQFRPDIVHNPPHTNVPASVGNGSGGQLESVVRRELAKGMPLHIAVQKLVEAGNGQQGAQEMVAAACDGRMSYCPQCQCYYAAAVPGCAQCQGALQPYQA